MTHDEQIAHAARVLEKLRRLQLKADLIAGFGYADAVIIGLWLIGITIEAVLHLSPVYRTFLLSVILIGSLLSVGVALWRIWRTPRLRPGRYAEEWWALAIGRFYSAKIRDRLLNAIQINRPQEGKRYNQSGELAKTALYSVVADMKDIPIDDVIDRRGRTRGIYLSVTSILFACLTLLTFSNTLIDASSRLVHPRTQYTIAPSFTLSVEPAGGWAYRGESVEFIIEAGGEHVPIVDFVYHYQGGDAQIERVKLNNGTGKITFDGFSESIIYSVRREAVQTTEYHLDIVTRPQVVELQYRLFSPHYSRLPVDIGTENVGDVEALPGSRLETTIRANKPLKTGWLVFQPEGSDSTANDTIIMSVTGQTAIASFGLMHDGQYHVRLLDVKDHPDKDPISYRIRMLTDEYPAVRITYPDTDIDLGDEMVIPMLVDADDDFGISRLEMAYRLLESDEEIVTFSLKPNLFGGQSVSAEYMWNLGDLAIMPGDVIEYWALAWDNDVVSGPKKAESERRLVRLPSIDEIIAGVDQAEQIGIEEAENTLEAARDLKEKMAEIIEEMKRNPEVDWEKQRQIESTVEQQSDIQKQVEELKARIDELIEQMEKHDLLTAETMEKYQELQQLISEIATPEMLEAMRKLQEAMESQNPEDIRKALEQLDMDREEYLRNIERSLNILKQLQLERKMDELAKRAEEMLHSQEEILSGIKNEDAQKLAAQQKTLAEQMEAFEQDVDDVRKLAEESGESELVEDFDKLMERMKEMDIPSSMKSASENLSENRLDMAAEQGEQSARNLSELAASMSSASMNFKNRKKTELAKKLRRYAEDLLYVSQNQEGLHEKSLKTRVQSPRYRSLAGTQEDIRLALEGVTRRMFELSRETFFVTPHLGAALGQASEEMENSLQGYSDRRPRSVDKPQVSALGKVNDAARQIFDILSQLEGSSSSSGYEEMMQQMADMASAQQSLNQQSMPVPGQDGSGGEMPFDSQQFSRMAAQQRALQQQMEQLSESSGSMEDVLGDLDGITKAMGQVSEDLEDKKITDRTRRLQRQIVSRLLDATRSMREREYSRKRESRVGKDIARKSPNAPTFNTDRDKLRRDLARALQEGYTRDYRALIRAYFRALEQAEGRK